VHYSVSVGNNTAGNCNIVGATVTLHCPAADGTPTGLAIVLAASLDMPFPTPTFVLNGDVQCTVVTTTSKTAQATVSITGGAGSCTLSDIDTASGSATATVGVRHPCVTITKLCPPACTPYGQPIVFTGVVHNCGDEPLDGTITDVPAATITPNSFTGLAPGADLPFTGTYTPSGTGAALCGPFSDTVTVNAIGVDSASPVTASATATDCPVCNNPCVNITKDCASIAPPSPLNRSDVDQTYTVSGIVSNCGNVPLVNVHVVDVITLHPANGGASSSTTVDVLVGGSLDIGATLPVTATITVPAGFCGTITDHFTVTADSICGGAAPSVTTPDCTVTVNCPPEICVTKQVTCSPASPGVCDDSLTYGESAAGVEGATKPSFCYKIVVTNCGQDSLHNVTISDPDLPGLTVPATLTIGQSVTLFASHSWGVSDSPHVNTVTVNGVGDSSGISVSDSDDATVTVVPISVICAVTLIASNDQDNNPNDNHLLLPPTDAGTTISGGFHVVVSNTGQSTVNVNVTEAFTGDVSLANCVVVDDTGTPVDPQPADFTAIPLAAGAHVNIICDINLGPAVCPAAAITVTVVGTAVATTDFPCIFDSNGNAIQTTPSQCSGSINCQTPTTCRTTGGGDLYNGDQNTDCVTTTTVLSPSQTPNGILLDHTSHGGQLGAPYSHEDCASILADPCIRGQWQHNRHFVGKANPRDVFEADFHSATPKGLYDTLLCACLGCCPGETTKKGPKGLFSGLGQHFELCNPAIIKNLGKWLEALKNI
jgi:hypothetical protein